MSMGSLYVLLREEVSRSFAHFLKIFIVIQLQLYAFSPHPSTPITLPPKEQLHFIHVESTVQVGICQGCGFNPWSGLIKEINQ